MKRCLFGGITLALFWKVSFLAVAAELHTPIISALETLDETNLDLDWYFTMEVTENEELRVIESDPHREGYGRRQLVSVNGTEPDEKQREQFYDAEVERLDGEDTDHKGYLYLVDTQTLEIIESRAGYSEVSFQPRVKAFENSQGNIRGTILFNSATQAIEQIEILNTQPLSPAFSVTVETYRLTLRFQQEQGENLLKALESHAVGTIGFLKGFDSLVKATFRDYRRAEP